ncbi:carbohydrate kinase family protein [Enterocloster asparagiformis]|uniref:carbohydrate kinase family protein n=1 Tax=Enterocloster asparagiformis TaxID=333367 RepID=UPI000465D301|nr:carbohydrate kinase family protein [Enterocloster asparagiformis]
MGETKKVFFIGDVAMDEYYSAPYFPKIKEKILVQTLPAQMGGMIANAACVYAGYGAPVSFLTALNPGAVSKELCRGLNEAGIDTEFMVWDESLPDAKTIIILAEGEHTVFIPTLNLQRIELSGEAMEALRQADYIYSTFCELRPLRFGEMTACQVLEDVKARGCRLWVDLDVADIQDGDESLFGYVDTLFVNEKGYENLERWAGGDVCAWLYAKGVRRLIVTQAEKGCTVYCRDEETFSVDGLKVPVVDVTGAGDTFCSSFLYGYTRGMELRQCAEFANYAASRAVTELGARAGAVGAEAVLDWIEKHGGDRAEFEKFL